MKKTYHSRQLEGILCVDKPQDWTSFDVVAKMRGIADCHKIGHGGTLDPMATGVLPLFFGRSAKAMELMPVQDKRYTASIRFGVTTDTQDCTGNILSTSEKSVTKKALEAALAPLRGTIDQLPPMYSAVWVDGQRLYKLARAGKEVERPTRQVTLAAIWRRRARSASSARCQPAGVRCSRAPSPIPCGSSLRGMRQVSPVTVFSQRAKSPSMRSMLHMIGSPLA